MPAIALSVATASVKNVELMNLLACKHRKHAAQRVAISKGKEVFTDIAEIELSLLLDGVS